MITSRSLLCRTSLLALLPRPVAPVAAVAPAQKAALIMGLTYGPTVHNYDDSDKNHKSAARLHGCHNDVLAIHETLVNTGKFCENQITMLTDVTDYGKERLTSRGIKQALSLLACRSHAEDLDTMFVFFSGHGTQLPDENGDESDGRDEALVGEDFDSSNGHGVIADDWLSTWVLAVNDRTRIVMVLDCCNSGSLLDTFSSFQQKLLYLSASRDSELSADAYNVNGNGIFSGMFTTNLLQALQKDPQLWDDAPALHAEVLHRIRETGAQQTPVLMASYDLNQEPVFL